MSDNLTELIRNTAFQTPPDANLGIPDNLALIAAIVTIVLGASIITASIVMLWRRGIFTRFFRRFKRLFKCESVTFLLQNNSCSHLVGKFIEEDLQKATSVIIIWQNGDNDIYAITDDNLDDARAAGMMLSMANKVSSDNGN